MSRIMRNPFFAFAILVFTLCWVAARAGDDPTPLADPKFFPIAVWLQNASNAAKYRDIGINVYVALYRGPTEQQLADLKKHGIRVVCRQNEVALRHKDD